MILYIIFGVVIYFAYKIYSFVQCPEELKNIPAAPLLTFLNDILDKRDLRKKMEYYYQPLLNKYGVIRVN
jgi:hypothetical protein